MKLFENNGFRIAAVLLVLFLLIPFLVKDSKAPIYDEAGNIVSSQAVGISGNPLMNFFKRVGSFYGLGKKKAAPAPTTQAARMAHNNGDINLASSKSAASVTNMPSSIPQEVEEYVQLGDKAYKVMTDPLGHKYVVMENGPVSFDELMAATLSEEDAALLQRYHAGERSPMVIEAYEQYADKGYFDNEGNFVFTSPLGMEGPDRPDMFNNGGNTMFDNGGNSMFGGPVRGERRSGNTGGFGTRGISGGDEAGAVDAQANLAGKYAGARARTSAINKAREAVAQQQQQYAQQTEGQRNLIEANALPKTPAILASLKEGKPTAETKGRKKFGAEEETAESDKDVSSSNNSPKLLPLSGNGVNTGNTKAGEIMTDSLLQLKKGEVFKGLPQECKVEDNAACKAVLNPWPLPEGFEDRPIFSVMKEFNAFDYSEDVNKYADISDKKYSALKTNLASNPAVNDYKIIMHDGILPNGQIGYVDRSRYQAQIMEGLFGGKGQVLEAQEVNRFLKTMEKDAKTKPYRVIVTAPNEEVAQYYRAKGFTAIVFNDYAITPDIMNNVYTGVERGVKDIADRETNQSKMLADLKNATPGTKKLI